MSAVKPRHLEPLLSESLRHFPTLLLVGARQVGKSTLARMIAERAWPARYFTLDDRTALDAALTDPDGFIQGLPRPAIIDEVQRAPDLLRAVKLVVDGSREPGTFLLTGSANVLTLSKVSETLAGRIAVHQLDPFSWTELDERPAPEILDLLFGAGSAADVLTALPANSPPDGFRRLQDLLLSGGYPLPALMTSAAARAIWFDSYRQTYLERDVRDVADISHLPDFNRLLSTLALRTGGMLNVSELSRDLALPATTLRRYFNILIQTYQAFLLLPYSGNLGKRLVKTPKVYLTDTGLACHLSGADSWEALMRQNRAGPLLETWAVNELRKLLACSVRHTDVSYWRDHSGSEVDFLLERGGQFVGIEAKLSRRAERKDLAGLRSCAEALGERWKLGVLLHGGSEVIAVDRRTLAVPYHVFFNREPR